MRNVPDRAALDVLACEIELRPAGAPGFDAIANAIVNVQRDGERQLAVSFDPAAAPQVEAFAAAECQCCSTLRWTVERGDGVVRLRVGAEPAQIDVLEALFTQTP
jgi:hypothetical protein